MTEIRYTLDAFASLTSLLNFIESKNTSGSALRWLEHYEKFISDALLNAKRKRLCNNDAFRKLNLRCIYYNDWLIAFSIHQNFILI